MLLGVPDPEVVGLRIMEAIGIQNGQKRTLGNISMVSMVSSVYRSAYRGMTLVRGIAVTDSLTCRNRWEKQ